MDILSVIGVAAALGVILFGMLSGGIENAAQILNFYDASAVAVVAGGTFAALMIMFPPKAFAELPGMLAKIFLPRRFNPRRRGYFFPLHHRGSGQNNYGFSGVSVNWPGIVER